MQIKTRIRERRQMAQITIRTENEKDYRQVEEVTRSAFSYPGRIERGGIGCPYEHWMVHELRKRDGIAELSLVAEISNLVVGHIICSIAVVKNDRNETKVLNFGPLSVLPEYQRKGVGKALILSMIEKAKKLGYGAILFFGRPEYYPQFGFEDAVEFGVTDAYGGNYSSFMAMELQEGYLSEVRGGKFYESDVFDEDMHRDEVVAFDKSFMSI